jgi:prevent-host-death family protein
MTVTTSVSELKARLSAFLDQVEAGGQVIVTERGRVVAHVVPPPDPGPNAHLRDELVRAGILTAARGTLDGWWSREHTPDPEAKLLAAVLHERDDAR